VSARWRSVLERQWQTVGHAQLLYDEIHAGDLFGDRMLDLQARVDFKEGQRAVGAEQVFHGARVHITGLGADVACRGVDAFALRVAEEGRGSFFHQFLVASLQRAVARAKHHDVAMRVGNHLCFDVARLVEELFDEAFAAPECRDGFARGGGEELFHLIHAPRDLHAATAAAERGLDDDGQAVLLGKCHHFARVLHRILGACHERRACIHGHLARAHLVAQQGNRGGLRADPDQPGIDHGLRKRFALRQETVAGVNRVSAALLGDAQDFFDVQIGVGGALAVQAEGFIGHAHVQGIKVAVGIDGDGLHAIVGTGAHHADGNLASVGNQDFFHGVLLRGWCRTRRARSR